MLRKRWGMLTVALVMLIGSTAIGANLLTPVEKFGKDVYKNQKLSLKKNQACNTCHQKNAAFADPANANNPAMFPVSEGSNSSNTIPLFGDRNAPSAAYAGFSPQFHWNDADGLFIGGVFWDGRASGIEVTDTGRVSPTSENNLSGTLPTYDPMADQAKGPFQNPIEMAMPNLSSVVDTVLQDKSLFNTFATLFPDAFDINGAVITPVAYNHIAEAIAAFERSTELNKFSSRFDQFVQEQINNNSSFDVSRFGVMEDCIVAESDDGDCFNKYVGPPDGFTSQFLTQQELVGLALFNADSATQLELTPVATNGVMSYLCHLTTKYKTAEYATGGGGNLSLVPTGDYPPLFTDFSYDNLGIPENTVARALSGATGPDNGLGAQVAIMNAANFATDNASSNIGKFKVPSLRGVELSPPYGHNGYFVTLTDIVNFYNDRDAFYTATSTAPEQPENMNESELGNLDMTPESVDAIVAFMKTLTDQ